MPRSKAPKHLTLKDKLIQASGMQNVRIGVATIIIVAIAAGLAYMNSTDQLFKQSEPTPTKPPVQLQIDGLPEGWTRETENGSGADIILTKKTDAKVRATVVQIDSERESDIDPEKYVDNLIQGARKTLPSLLITSEDTTESDSVYTHALTGHYVTGGQRVEIRQTIRIVGRDVRTITSSTGPQEDASIDRELDVIFKFLLEE